MPSKERMAGSGQVSNFGPDNPKEWETFTSSSISTLVNWLDFNDTEWITTATVNPGNPLAYYNMEEGGSGTTLTDRSQEGAGLNGVISNGAWSTDEKKSGTYSLEFNGSSTSVEIDELCDDMVDVGWSVGFWVMTADTSTAEKTIFCINSNTSTIRVWLGMTGGYVKVWDTAYRGYEWDRQINDTEWHHIAMVYIDGTPGIYRVYIDGALDTTYENASLSVGASDLFTLGAYYSGGSLTSFWDGYMDDVVVFDSAITSQQVKDLYNNGGTPPDLTSATIAANDVVLQAVCKVTDREWGPFYGHPAMAPIWETKNGKKAAKFLRGEYLTGSLTAGSYTQPTTIITALQLDSTGTLTQQEYEHIYDGDDATYRQLLYRQQDDLLAWAGTTNFTMDKTQHTSGSLDIVSVGFNQRGSYMNAYITGSTIRNSNTNIGAAALQGFTIGARYTIQTSRGPNRFSGSVAEVLIFDDDISMDDHLLATTYLADKWKIFKEENIDAILEPDDTPLSTTFDILD
tara:strand:- start:143 stop:1684 length:1542 start_codon:yes stop_codon:yes gene_type:complete